MSSNATNVTAEYPASYLERNRGQQLINAAIVFGVLEPVFFALFVIARRLTKTASGLDFWLMVPAFFFCFAHVPLMIVFVLDAGAGRPYVTVPYPEFVLWLKLIFVEEFLYIVSVTLPKLAILALYRRLFATTQQRVYRWAMAAIVVLMGLNVLVDFILAIVTCRPVAFNWDLTIPGGYCGDKMGPYRYISLPNILTDIFILILPIRVVWGLQTGRTNKIGLTITFLTGSIGIVTSILRLTTFFTVDLFADPTYNVVQTMTWTCAEPGVYFIAACLPSLRPLLRSVLETVNPTNFLGRSGGSSGKGIRLQDQTRVSGDSEDAVAHHQTPCGINKKTVIQITYDSSDDTHRLV